MIRILMVLACLTILAVPAMAGSPHFVGAIVSSQDGHTLTISGKEAGLGNETQVHIVVTATAGCINPGSHHPKAANKETFTAEGTFPVQNGKAEFTLTLTAVLSPDCTPPMTLLFDDIVVCDVDHSVCIP